MAVNDTDARKARAEELRRRIQALKKDSRPSDQSDKPATDETRPNYRALIDERMHELDDKE